MSELYVQTTAGEEGPLSLADLAERRRSGQLPGSAPVSRDRARWEPLDALIDREAPEEGIYVDCLSCDHHGVLTEGLPGAQKVLVVLVSLVLLALLGAMGWGASQIILWKLKTQGNVGKATPGFYLFFFGSAAFTFARRIAMVELRLGRKWKAWWSKACPYCEGGLRKRHEIGIPAMMAYLLDLFVFQEVLVPTYKTLTFQWLWRDPVPKDETRLGRLVLFLGFTLAIAGSVPFLAFLAGRNSAVTLGASALVAFAVWRMTFVKSSSVYMKGVAFIMVPLYYVSMVELIRWCWILSIPPEGVPPDTSDLYLLGVDTLLSTQLFFGLPNKIGLRLFSGSVDTALTGWAVFYLRLLLDMSLIGALAKALTNAIWSAQVYRQTGLRGGLGKADSKALATIQEIGLRRDPQEITRLEKSLKDVASVLGKVKGYVKGVSVAAEPGSDQKAAADRALAVVDGADLKTFSGGGGGKPEKRGDGAGPTVVERLLSVVVVAAWACVFAWFFGGAIKRAIARDVADLIERAGKPELKDNPLARRTLYERALRKAPDHHELLLLASRTDLDVAARRVFLLDLDQALIEIDTAFQKTIHLQELTGLEKNPYLADEKEISARAYGLRGRVFYLRNDRERATAELRKERTLETRRLLFLLALDRAAEDILSPQAKSELAQAIAELGIDEAFKPGLLVTIGHAILELRSGKLEEGLQELRPLETSLDAFSRPLRSEVRYVIAESLLRLDQRERDAAIKVLREVLAESPELGEARLALGHALRLGKDVKGAKAAFEAALLLPDQAVTEHASLGLALLALERKDTEDAKRIVAGLAEKRDTDPLFREDLGAFLDGKISPEALHDRAGRWREDQHHAQEMLASVAVALRSIAAKGLGPAALELRDVVIAGEPGHAEVDFARTLLDLIQVEKERRSFNPDLFFHQLHLTRLGRRIRDEVKLILFPPEETTRTLALALDDRRPPERSRAITAVSNGKLLDGALLRPLLERGLDDKDAEVRLAAIEALGGLGPDAARASLAKVASARKDPDARIRRASVRVMQVAGGLESERTLEDALEDADRYVRRDAAYALARIGAIASHSLSGLVKHLDDPEVMVRDAALAGVRALDRDGAEALVPVIGKARDTEVSIQAIKHLETAHPAIYERERPAITAFALKVLASDPDPASRRWAAVRLASLKRDERVAEPSVLEKIAAGLRAAHDETQDPSVRMGIAVATLKATRTYGTDPGLAVRFYVESVRAHPNLKDDILSTAADPLVGEAALYVVEALLREKDLAPQGTRLLRAVVGAKSLAEKADPAPIASAVVARLLPLAASDDERLAKDAGEALNEARKAFPDSLMAPILLAHLADPSERVRSTVLDVTQVKGVKPDAELKARLVQGLLAKDAGIRKAHFILLRYLAFEDESATDAIVAAALGDPDAEVQASALRAVARSRPLLERVLPALEEKRVFARNDDVGKGALVIVLGERGPEKALEALGQTDAATRKRFVLALTEWAGSVNRPDPAVLTGALARLLDDADPGVSFAALGALIAPEPRKDLAAAAPALRRILAQPRDPKMLPLARAALVLAAPAEADAELVRSVLSEKSSDLGKRTIAAIAPVATEGRAALLLSGLSSPQADVRAAAARALAGIGAEAHDALRIAIASKSVDACEAGLDAIAAQGSAALPLARAVTDLLGVAGTPRIEAAAVKALGRTGYEPAREQIRGLVTQRNDPVLQAECWIALGRLGLKESSGEIARLLDTGAAPSAAYTTYLARSLVEVDRDAGLRYLQGSLRERYGRVDGVTAAGLLGAMGSTARPALRQLQALALDANPELRAAASDAIGKIQDDTGAH